MLRATRCTQNHDVEQDANVYSLDDPNGALSFIAHLVLLQEQGLVDGHVGDDAESQKFADDVRRLNDGGMPGKAPVVPNRSTATFHRVTIPRPAALARRCSTPRTRETGSRRTTRRASARAGPTTPENPNHLLT